jgi:hypothetical protein
LTGSTATPTSKNAAAEKANDKSPRNKPSFLYLVKGMRHSIGITAKDFAYKAGQGLKNNVLGWYQGGGGFFDNYIISTAC